NSFTMNGSDAVFAGNITGSNLSGTNTGDQTWSSFNAGYGLVGNPYNGTITRTWTIDDQVLVSLEGDKQTIEVSSGSANDDRGTGFYNLQSPVTDTPLVGGTKLLNVKRNSNEGFQISAGNINSNEFYVRNKYNGVWQSWEKLYTHGNLNPVETDRTISAGTG